MQLTSEMKEEFVKPWIAMANNAERWRLFGWKSLGWRGAARFVLTLASSICFLLLGAAMNTIGIPKGRWYPDLFPKSESKRGFDGLQNSSDGACKP